MEKKKHADFQDESRRSSNFGNAVTSNEEDLKIKGNGKLKLKKDDKMNSKEEDDEVSEVLDSLTSEEE